MQLFGRQQRKAFAQVKTHLITEYGARTRTGAV